MQRVRVIFNEAAPGRPLQSARPAGSTGRLTWSVMRRLSRVVALALLKVVPSFAATFPKNSRVGLSLFGFEVVRLTVSMQSEE